MANNVASFEEFDNDQQIEAHQSCLVRVVLEGKTDVELFSRFWFHEFKDTFNFIEAGRLGAGAGCTGVQAAVMHSRTEEIPAVGIVDRDTLFRSREWARVFSLSDAEIPTNWNDSSIYITSRWEVEAYLLEPAHLKHWVTFAYRDETGPADKCERALAQTLTACEILLVATPFLASQHEVGIEVPPGFLFDKPLHRAQQICKEKIESLGPAAKAVATEVDALVENIVANQPGDAEERLPFLLRYVDTKRLLFFLPHMLNLNLPKGKHWVFLASHMQAIGRRPSELEQVLRAVAADLAV